MKEDLLKPIEDEDSIYEAQKACDYLQRIANTLRPRQALNGTENGFQMLEDSLSKSEKSLSEDTSNVKP